MIRGVVEVWSVINHHIRDRRREQVWLVRDIYQLHIDYARDHGVRRAQCRVRDNFPEGELFAKHLGYKWESTMECWGDDDTNIHMYVWLAKEHGL